MSNCIITNINNNIKIYFDDVVPRIDVKVLNDTGKLILENEYRNTHNVVINGNKILSDGFIIVDVNTGDGSFKKRLFHKKL